MSIDFSALVLTPCMNILGVAMTVTPLVSQPGAPAFPARGVFEQKDTDMIMAADAIMSQSTRTIGVKLNDVYPTTLLPMFPIWPVTGDIVTIVEGFGADVYVIDDTDDDGEGGSLWTLKRTTL